MNQLDFNILSGWPGSAETWQFMQNMILQLQQLSLVGGTNYIVNGCVVTGGTTGNGLMVINGEILPFEGGPNQSNVVIIDTATKKQFFGGAMNNYYHNRKVVFGSGGGSIAFSSFKRNDPANGVLSRLDRVEKMLKPLVGYVDPNDSANTVYGSWLFWGRPAAEIPSGWQAVPDADWKGRVPVVMDDTDADFEMLSTGGKTGGNKTHQLTQAELPHVKIKNGLRQNGGAYLDQDPFDNIGTAGTGTQLETDYLGDGTAINIMNPYKVVMFIRWIG